MFGSRLMDRNLVEVLEEIHEIFSNFKCNDTVHIERRKFEIILFWIMCYSYSFLIQFLMLIMKNYCYPIQFTVSQWPDNHDQHQIKLINMPQNIEVYFEQLQASKRYSTIIKKKTPMIKHKSRTMRSNHPSNLRKSEGISFVKLHTGDLSSQADFKRD